MSSAPLTRRSLARFLAWEAVTSLGESAAETGALLRAGLCNVAPSRFVNARGEQMLVCGAPAVPAGMTTRHRVGMLGGYALEGLRKRLADTAWTDPSRPLTVVLAMAERLKSDGPGTALTRAGQDLADAVRENLPGCWTHAALEIYPYGRAGGAAAMRRALQLLDGPGHVIWGGVDTLCDWPTLQDLEQAERLLDAENLDGIRPGEAGAFVALGSPARQDEGSDSVGLLAVGLGREPAPMGAPPPWKSDGLSQALDAAVKPLRAAGRRTNYWLVDSSHEAYATQELQNIIARFGDVVGEKTQLQAPLKELGDCGAAAMPLLAVLGAQSWQDGHAVDDVAVVTGSSVGGARGALLLGGPAAGTFRAEVAA